MAKLVSQDVIQVLMNNVASEIKKKADKDHAHVHGENLLRWGKCITYGNPNWSTPVINTAEYAHGRYCSWELLEDVENTIQGYSEDVLSIKATSTGYCRYELVPSSYGGLESGATYTFSYSFRKPSGSTVDENTIMLQVYWYDANGDYHYQDCTVANATVIEDSTATNGWKRVASTFTIPEGMHNTYAFFRFDATATGAAGTVYFKEMKLELGEKATEFTPSPLDLHATYGYVDSYCGWLEDELEDKADKTELENKADKDHTHEDKNLIKYGACNLKLPVLAYCPEYSGEESENGDSGFSINTRYGIMSLASGSVSGKHWYYFGAEYENCGLWNNKTYTLSFEMRPLYLTACKVTFCEYSDTAQGYVYTDYNLDVSDTGDYAPYSVTHTFNNGSEVAPDGKYIKIEFEFNSDGYVAYLANIQLEEGSVATSFQEHSSVELEQTIENAVKGTIELPDGTDLDNIYTAGKYVHSSSIFGWTNIPYGVADFENYILEVSPYTITGNNSYYYQRLTGDCGNEWIRGHNGMDYKSWQKVPHVSSYGLHIGDGVNLFDNVNFPTDITKYTSSNANATITESNGYMAITIPANTSSVRIYTSTKGTQNLVGGEEYVYSLTLYTTDTTSGDMQINMGFTLNGGTSFIYGYNMGMPIASNMNVPPQAMRYSIPFIANSSADKIGFALRINNYSDTAQTLYVKEAKIEKGNVATAWSE